MIVQDKIGVQVALEALRKWAIIRRELEEVAAWTS